MGDLIQSLSDIPPTWSVLAAAALLMGVGWSASRWFRKQMSGLKDSLLDAIKRSRDEGDRKVALVKEKVEDLGSKLVEHEIHVARNFVPREEISSRLDKIDKSIEHLGDKIDRRRSTKA